MTSMPSSSNKKQHKLDSRGRKLMIMRFLKPLYMKNEQVINKNKLAQIHIYGKLMTYFTRLLNHLLDVVICGKQH